MFWKRIVEEVGESVTKFKQGERVYIRLPLDRIGAFAEYVAVNEAALALTPNYLTDEKAAAVPLTALTAISTKAAHFLSAVRRRLTKRQIYGEGGKNLR